MSDVDEAIEKLGRKIENAIRYKISRRSPFKVSLCVYHKFDNTEKTRSEELKETDLLKIRSKNQLLLRGDNVPRFVRDLVEGYKISKEKGLQKYNGRSQINLEDIGSIRIDFHEVNPAGTRNFKIIRKYVMILK